MITEATTEDILALEIDETELVQSDTDDASFDEANFVMAEQPDFQDGLEARIAARSSSSENISSEPTDQEED